MTTWGEPVSRTGPHFEYELWRERWRILERRNGGIYRTEKIDEGWWPADEVDNNRPSQTDILYVMGGENCPDVAIRRKR